MAPGGLAARAIEREFVARDKRKKRETDESLRGLLRQQRSEIKHLKKQLGRSQKQNRRNLETDFSPELEVVNEVVNTLQCNKCGCKKVVEIDIGIKMYHMCKGCGHRKVITKEKAKNG